MYNVYSILILVSLYPLELIKTRMQVIDGKNEIHYRNLYSSFRIVAKNEGFGGFYKGVTPAVIAAAGSWGGYFYIYEISKKRKLSSKGGIGRLNTIDHVSIDNIL